MVTTLWLLNVVLSLLIALYAGREVIRQGAYGRRRWVDVAFNAVIALLAFTASLLAARHLL